MKTRYEVDRLISGWRLDPDWDLENSAGFEEYKEELLAYRLNFEAKKAAELKQIREKQLTDDGIHGKSERGLENAAIVMCLLRIAHALERIADQGETTIEGEDLRQSVEIFGAG